MFTMDTGKNEKYRREIQNKKLFFLCKRDKKIFHKESIEFDFFVVDFIHFKDHCFWHFKPLFDRIA